MTTDNLYSNEQARALLLSGIKKAAQAIGGTMGTSGSNALIEAIESPGHLATNDGATILGAIKFSNPIEEMGRKILLEAVSRANKASGDGSSTTTVLTAALIEEGLSLMANSDGVTPMDIKRSLEAEITTCEALLKEQVKDITVHDVHNVASISAEDDAIGNLIQEIYEQIGADGIIHWDISKTNEDSYTIGNGITMHGAGYLSPYMCDIDEKTGQFLNIARWRDAHILIIRQKITSASDFNTLFSELYNKEIKEVVVFCEDIEATVIPDLIQTRAVRGFKTLVVKMPVLWRDWWYEDLAIATGATIIDPNAGISLKTMKAEHLGKVGHIVVGKDETFIDGIRDVSDHIKALQEDGTDDGKIRASRLNTRTARLFIGAQSDSALSYKRLKVEDAISAAWQALHGGVVPGGGVAMIKIAKQLDPTKSPGTAVLSVALNKPASQIAENAGHKFNSNDYMGNFGLDTKTGLFVDMFEANIVNPYTVELNAIKNAVSVAATVLTAKTVVTLPREEETELATSKL